MATKGQKKATPKRTAPKAEEQKTMDLTLTEVQVEMLQGAYQRNAEANQNLQLVLSAVLAGENIGRAQIVNFNPTLRVLTILEPESRK